jgi:lantibiotic leader peptide-processing serine protease
MHRSSLLMLAATAGLIACTDNSTAPTEFKPSLSMSLATSDAQSYVILGSGNKLPADLAARITAAGGTLVNKHEAIGVAVATGGPGFAAAARGIAGVEGVARNLAYEQPAVRVVDLDVRDLATNPTDDLFYFIQWAPAAVHAPEAWNAGYTGTGARVAILDGGLYNAHQDLTGKVDVGASKSFACVPRVVDCWHPDVNPATRIPFNSDLGTFWHGTHVAGIVGASDNAFGGIGIAPSATLIGVKVLHNGTGLFSWIIDGITYAAKPIAEGGAGAQVINMSLGALIDMDDPETLKADVLELDKAISRATSYAWDQGVTVVASAGNDAEHLGKQFLTFPAMSQKVISVAATAPMGWAFGNKPFSNAFERQASYTNFGKKGVDLAAPGGDSAWPGDETCIVLRTPTTGIQNACWVFDMYLSTSRGSTAPGGYSWAAGTSMASPVVAGVAALIIGKANGNISPAQVKARLQQGAIDHGKPGNDDVYGAGFVDAFASLKK